jgi:hypothetical protein
MMLRKPHLIKTKLLSEDALLKKLSVGILQVLGPCRMNSYPSTEPYLH